MGHYRGFKTCILEGTMKFQQLTVRSGDSPWCGGTISSPVWESLQLPGSFLQTQHTTVPDKWESSVYDAMLRLPSSSVSPSDRACAQESGAHSKHFNTLSVCPPCGKTLSPACEILPGFWFTICRCQPTFAQTQSVSPTNVNRTWINKKIVGTSQVDSTSGFYREIFHCDISF